MPRAAQPKYPHIPNPSTQVRWADLRAKPGLQKASLAARGLYLDMLGIMAGGGGYLAIDGQKVTIAQLAAYAGKPVPEVEAAYRELGKAKIYAIDAHGCAYDRAMVRGGLRAIASRQNGKKGGRPKKQASPMPSPDLSTLSPQQSPELSPKLPFEGLDGCGEKT